jgi:hypothetical protein
MHRCLVCDLDLVPVYRAICVRCFPAVPWKLRADILQTYRCRVSRPKKYTEKLIELRLWVRDNGRRPRE